MPDEVPRFDRSYEVVGKWLKKQKASLKGDSKSVYNAKLEMAGLVAEAFVVPLATGVVMIFEAGIKIDAERKAQLALIANDLNDHVPFGNFEISLHGNFVFKISTFFGDSEEDTFTFLSRCLGAAAAMLLIYVPSVSLWMNGELAAEGIVVHARDAERRRNESKTKRKN